MNHVLKVNAVDFKQKKKWCAYDSNAIVRVAASGTRSEDDCTCGTGLCFYRRRQAAHRWYKFNMDGGWLGRFR